MASYPCCFGAGLAPIFFLPLDVHAPPTLLPPTGFHNGWPPFFFATWWYGPPPPLGRSPVVGSPTRANFPPPRKRPPTPHLWRPPCTALFASFTWTLWVPFPRSFYRFFPPNQRRALLPTWLAGPPPSLSLRLVHIGRIGCTGRSLGSCCQFPPPFHLKTPPPPTRRKLALAARSGRTT